jgi:hypothetical protein
VLLGTTTNFIVSGNIADVFKRKFSIIFKACPCQIGKKVLTCPLGVKIRPIKGRLALMKMLTLLVELKL